MRFYSPRCQLRQSQSSTLVQNSSEIMGIVIESFRIKFFLTWKKSFACFMTSRYSSANSETKTYILRPLFTDMDGPRFWVNVNFTPITLLTMSLSRAKLFNSSELYVKFQTGVGVFFLFVQQLELDLYNFIHSKSCWVVITSVRIPKKAKNELCVATIFSFPKMLSI